MKQERIGKFRKHIQNGKATKIIKKILIIVSIPLLLLIVRVAMILGIAFLIFLIPSKNISGVENYSKDYFIKEYGGDLDSSLAVFPNNKDNLKDAEFSSSFKVDLFDSNGYILLVSRYNKEDFDNEINRLKKLELTIYDDCKSDAKSFTNYIKYDENSYKYPAYITIDGFGHAYEYALINKDKLEIIYVYLSYPEMNNKNYKDYLKNNKSSYFKDDTLDMFSMYNHSFDNGNSFMEYSDCN